MNLRGQSPLPLPLIIITILVEQFFVSATKISWQMASKTHAQDEDEEEEGGRVCLAWLNLEIMRWCGCNQVRKQCVSVKSWWC